MSKADKELKEKLQKLVLDTIQADKDLRDKYQVGDKFRFIRDRLAALGVRVEEEMSALKEEIEKKTDKLMEDEALIYVYLFNAQGLAFQSWQKMVHPSVFYEYSVNRPIYMDKAQIESYIRSRSNKAQHGFLTIAVKKGDILNNPPGVEPKDQNGNPLFKIKEGTLLFNKMFSFTYQENEYVVNQLGQIIKKENI